MAQKTVLIKKYENRRLYDATNSRYVNLEEVAQILKAGDDVRAIDVATGADITRLILTQIIVEDAKTPNSDFPLEMLRQMVIASGRASQESALKYMNAMLDIYQNTYRAISPGINPFDAIRKTGAAGDSQVYPSGPGLHMNSDPARTPETEDGQELRSRVAELEKIVSSLAPKKPIRKKSGRKRKTIR